MPQKFNDGRARLHGLNWRTNLQADCGSCIKDSRNAAACMHASLVRGASTAPNGIPSRYLVVSHPIPIGHSLISLTIRNGLANRAIIVPFLLCVCP